VRVAVAVFELEGGKLVEGLPKSEAGLRTVALPDAILAELRAHAEKGPDGRIFVGPKGGPLRRSSFRRIWNKVRADVGLPDLHFHDLRHVGNTLAARNASLRELMARMGHASTRAALIYQHTSEERDRKIAAELGKVLKAARKGTTSPRGTRGARKRK
jgi:integrase